MDRQLNRQNETDHPKHASAIASVGNNDNKINKKHLKNVGPIRHCEPFYIAIHQVSLLSHAATVARRLRIDVHDNDNNDNNNDNA